MGTIISSAKYDEIAKSYQASKQLDFRKKIDQYTLLNLVGDVTRLRVLDLACGEGIYSRLLKAKGAQEVVGVDLSTEMIELAKDQRQGGMCEFLVGDASGSGSIRKPLLGLSYAKSSNHRLFRIKIALFF